jgi:CheY-like chemotaxis protein/nitrogen-specific signal transduction histidine kinase
MCPAPAPGETVLFATAIDVTERRLAEQRLRRSRDAAEAASRAKSQFLANMSHELRTPLNAIMGYSYLLQQEAAEAGQDRFIPDLQRVHQAGAHLLGLINEVLDLSRIEAGRMELHVESFEIAALVNDVTRTIGPLLEQNRNTLAVNCPGALGSMRADQTRTRQILFSLLSNASKFTESGTITISAERRAGPEGEWIRFVVSDTGIGMTPQQLEHVFEAFAQGDATTTRRHGGAGLGLAISRHFSRMMGGDINVTSTPQNGSIFTVLLPARVDPTAPPAAEATPDAAGHPTVLVIDDDVTMLDLLQRTLGRDGFHVVTCESGEAGLERARQLQPAVITLDVMMPRMDGWSVLTALKSDPQLAEIPVVMLTMVDDRNMGYALGAADFLTKPVDSARLSAVVRKHARTHTGGSVLIVEDDADARQVLERTLQQDGWTVVEAEHGRAALDLLRRTRPDLILLDLMMPEMDGFAFLEAMKELEGGENIPVVIVTARDLTENDRRRLDGAVEEVLQKGAYRQEDLLHLVGTLVKRHASAPNTGEGNGT